MRNDTGKDSGFGSGAPGTEVCALSADVDEEIGVVSLYAAVPQRGSVTGSFVRFNLFADAGNTLQHIASAIAPAGTSGELIVVSGHVADSYHLFVQATNPRQDLKANLLAKSCCASSRVRVRADMLALAYADPEVSGIGALAWFPMVPWGVEFGAAQAFTVTGSGTLVLPAGARLTHWLAEGTGGGGTVQFNTTVPGSVLAVGTGLPVREGFPVAQPVTTITYAALAFGLFEVVA